MLQIFHLDVSKVDQVLHMLQWQRWLVDTSLLQGFGSYLVSSSCGAPHPLLSSPPLHLAAAVRTWRGNPTRRACKRLQSWWPRVGWRRRDARVVALEQAEVRAICSLRAGNKWSQPSGRRRLSGHLSASNALIKSHMIVRILLLLIGGPQQRLHVNSHKTC
jgi:hypothetical protein